jgi:hypothetical protein
MKDVVSTSHLIFEALGNTLEHREPFADAARRAVGALREAADRLEAGIRESESVTTPEG